MHDRLRQGVVYAIGAYGCWGLIPLYFKTVAQVPPLEVLAHRVVWSLVLLTLLVTLARRWGDFRRTITQRSVLLALAASTLLLGVNWLTYIYAVFSNQVVEASLGYFLNPLVNVVLGVVLLKEPMRGWQMVSVALAVAGVAIFGAPPIAITLALSFAFYGLLRKHVAVDGLLGLFIETILLAPLAIGYIALLTAAGRSAFVASDPATCLKLVASSVVTAVPLLLFTAAARRLRLSTLGFLQYLAPTVQFLLAVLVFDEELSAEKMIALVSIWAGVAVYSYDSLRFYQQQRRQRSSRCRPTSETAAGVWRSFANHHGGPRPMSDSTTIRLAEIRRRRAMADTRPDLSATRRPFLTAEWRYLAMLNFAIEAGLLRPWLPTGCECDVWRGTSYVSLVGFLFADLRVWGVPIPFNRNFPEVNLRFYVRRKVDHRWRRGVVFVREFAPRWLVACAAGWFYGENYAVVPMDHEVAVADDEPATPRAVSYSWDHAGGRHSLRMTTRGRLRPIQPDGLEAFIVDQAWGYSARAGRPTIEYRVEHPPWRIWEADDAAFDGDAAALYGGPFAEALAQPPASAFLVDGSAVKLFAGVSLAP